MELYAPFGVRLLPETGEVSDHQRDMIVAGASANGVMGSKEDEGDDSPIIGYIVAKHKLDVARITFSNS